MKRPMCEEDLLSLVWIADPQISPDGSRVAFTRVWVDAKQDEYRTQVWIAGTDGAPPRPLTAGTLDSQPRWSPDGGAIVFVRAAEPKKPGQLHLLPMSGGEALSLTRLKGGASDPS